MTEAPAGVRLRDATGKDIPAFFGQQPDPEANRLAAFTAKDPADRDAFGARWAVQLKDGPVTKKTILSDGRVAGHVASSEGEEGREVTYWLGREYWGRGGATRGLSLSLRLEKRRPLHARAAKDNAGSVRVLEKCGFEIRGEEVEEFVPRLEA